MGDCVFCGIIAGELPATIIHEDEHTVAFLDINPWRPGHTLVVPRRHAESLFDIEADELARVLSAARRVGETMRERLGCEQVHLWNSAGAAAGQVVLHFHLHVIPGDASDGEIPARPASPPEAEELERVAAALRT
jgi:histidine triad (HIT) family protein